MDNNYFVYKGIKYIVEYRDKKIHLFKYNNGNIAPLSSEEADEIKRFLNKEYGYVYNSDLLEQLVAYNPKIENKEYVLNLLTLLESTIPIGCRDNFYRNVSTLKTTLNTDLSLARLRVMTDGYSKTTSYNTTDNSLTMNEKTLFELWRIAQTTKDPDAFYWKNYSQMLLHELAHMASSRFDPETGVSLCGFDRFPAETEDDKNRGLTEGFTEIISMLGVLGT